MDKNSERTMAVQDFQDFPIEPAFQQEFAVLASVSPMINKAGQNISVRSWHTGVASI